MSDYIQFQAQFCMKPESEGGRNAAIQEKYCPHLVVPPSSKYLGVGVIGFAANNKRNALLPGECGKVYLDALYPDTVNYDALVEGAYFEIREGGTTVGTGTVIRREETVAWMPKIRITTAASLPFLSSEYNVLVVHCGAAWNGYDMRMDNLLQELRKEYRGRIEFCALDVDNGRNSVFLKEANVLNLPALVCFINGERYETLIGMRGREFWLWI